MKRDSKSQFFVESNECCGIIYVRGVSLFWQSISINISQDLTEIQEAETSSGKADTLEKLLTDLFEEMEV